MIMGNYTGDNLKIAEANGRILVRLGKINGICERAVRQLGDAEDAAKANRILTQTLQDIADAASLEQVVAAKKEGGAE